MNEALRQHYLKALGIPMWYARASLPGARVSPEFDFSGLEDELAQPVNVVARNLQSASSENRTAGRQAAAQLAASLSTATPERSEVRSSSVETLQPAPVDQLPAPAVEHQPVIAVESLDDAEVEDFTLRGYLAGNILLLNVAHPETDAHRETRLLTNIARSCFGGAGAVRSCFEFAWPVFSNPRLPGQGREVALAVLGSTLAEHFESAERLVLFGHLPVWPELKIGGVARTADIPSVPGSRQSLPAQVTYSLGELLLQPQLKRDVWLHLRSFLQAR